MWKDRIIPGPKDWKREKSGFLNLNRLWSGIIEFDDENSHWALENWDKLEGIDRELKLPYVAKLIRAAKSGLFIDDRVSVPVAVYDGKTYRLGAQHCLNMVANGNVGRKFKFRVVLYEAKSFDEMRDIFIQTDQIKRLTAKELARACLGGRKGIEGVADTALNRISSGYHTFNKLIANQCSKENIIDRDESTRELIDRLPIIKSIYEAIGCPGGISKYNHMHSASCVAVLCWILTNHKKDFDEFTKAVATGAGLDEFDARKVFRELLCKTDKRKNKSKRDSLVNCGMVAFACWKVGEQVNGISALRKKSGLLACNTHDLAKILDIQIKNGEKIVLPRKKRSRNDENPAEETE